MSELSDQELNVVRLRLLDLIKSFFIDEPEKDRYEVWKEIVSSLTTEKINPTMDSAVRKLDDMLTTVEFDKLKEEYYDLFIDPFSEYLVQTTLSYYVDGHSFGQSLVDLRRFLLKAEITKAEGLDESEDSVVFLVDILATLIREEEHDLDNAKKNQTKLLTQFLDPFSVHFNSALEKNKRAKFYEACAAFLSGYVDLEKGLMVDI